MPLSLTSSVLLLLSAVSPLVSAELLRSKPNQFILKNLFIMSPATGGGLLEEEDEEEQEEEEDEDEEEEEGKNH